VFTASLPSNRRLTVQRFCFCGNVFKKTRCLAMGIYVTSCCTDFDTKYKILFWFPLKYGLVWIIIKSPILFRVNCEEQITSEPIEMLQRLNIRTYELPITHSFMPILQIYHGSVQIFLPCHTEYSNGAYPTRDHNEWDTSIHWPNPSYNCTSSLFFFHIPLRWRLREYVFKSFYLAYRM
jgi:hypothetical protein